MNNDDAKKPNLTSATMAGKAARADRLAAEMRKNLIKRKRQQREKTAETEPEDSDGSAGMTDDGR